MRSGTVTKHQLLLRWWGIALSFSLAKSICNQLTQSSFCIYPIYPKSTSYSTNNLTSHFARVFLHRPQRRGRSRSRRYRTCSGLAAELRAPSSWANCTDRKWPWRKWGTSRRRTSRTCASSNTPTSSPSSESKWSAVVLWSQRALGVHFYNFFQSLLPL